MTERTLHDPKSGVDSEYLVRIVRATRNHELRVETGISGQAHQVGNPGRPDRTDPISELSAKFWSRKPKLGPSAVPCIENEVQWLNAYFFVLREFHFFICDCHLQFGWPNRFFAATEVPAWLNHSHIDLL